MSVKTMLVFTNFDEFNFDDFYMNTFLFNSCQVVIVV